MPMHNWYQVNKRNNLKYVFIKKRTPTDKEVNLLEHVYHSLMTEYIDVFGFTTTYKDILDKKRQIAIHQVDYMLTYDKMYLTLIDMVNAELESLIDKQMDVDLYKLKPKIEKTQKRQIDLKTTTVVEWHNLINSNNG